MSHRNRTTSRRDALAALGASASALAAARVVLSGHGRAEQAKAKAPAVRAGEVDGPALEASASAAELAELMGDVRAGSTLARCRVIEVRSRQLGGIAVRMETPAGVRFQLDVLRACRDGDGVGRAPGLAVHVSNGGDGSKRTDEVEGLAAMALGDALARRLREGARVPELLTFEERARRYPDGIFDV